MRLRRRPRATDPEPYTRLDVLDGLTSRYDAQMLDVLAAEAPGGVSVDEWSSLPPVFAPHSFVGGDLAAMAAPGDWPPFTDWGTYDIEPWPSARDHAAKYAARYVLGVASLDLPMVRAAATAYDLGLPVPLRSDPPIYRACLAGHVGAGVA